MAVQIVKGFSGDYIFSHKLLGRLDRIGNDSVKNFAENFLSATTPPPFFIPLNWKLSIAVTMTARFARQTEITIHASPPKWTKIYLNLSLNS